MSQRFLRLCRALKPVAARLLYREGSIRQILAGPCCGLRYKIFPQFGLSHLYGGWESEAQQIMITAIKPGNTAYDLGANYGMHALLMALLVGYNEFLFDSRPSDEIAKSPPEVLFVGGADRDPIEFMNIFLKEGPIVSLVGVMRTFEAGAIGGCLTVEDTGEHREIFGAEGETVRYFRTPSEAATLCRTLIAHPAERLRLATAVKTRIREGANTYADRLRTILAIAPEIRRGAHQRCGAPS